MSATLAYVPPRYLTCAETAKLVRAALKQEFPGQKFSVRSDTYSGGASIDVSWTDGPTAKSVDAVVGVFAGADFDGSIDLKTHTRHWLNPDGSVTVAHAQGTEGSRGYLPEIIGDPQHPSAQLVSFGADFVFTHREISDEWRDEILDHFETVIGRTLGDRDGWTLWQTQVPLRVRGGYGDDAGELLHMREEDGDDLSSVFHQYAGFRTR